MENCPFCRIAAKQQDASIIYESEDVIAFPDLNPSAPVHILIVPKRHIPTFLDIAGEDHKILMGMIEAIQALVRERHLEGGYRIGINGGSYQHVMHLHWHLVSRG